MFLIKNDLICGSNFYILQYIEGEYSLEGDNIIFTLFTTEVPNTEWELSFKDAINKKLFDGKYKMLTFFNFNEMILTYDNDSYLFFNNIDE